MPFNFTAGQLKHYVEIQNMTEPLDIHSAPHPTETGASTFAYAHWEQTGGGLQEIGEQQIAQHQGIWSMYYWSGLTTNHVIKYRGKTYYIDRLDDVQLEGRWWQVYCTVQGG